MIICRFHWFVCIWALFDPLGFSFFFTLISPPSVHPSFLTFVFSPLLFPPFPPSSPLLNHAYYPRSSLCWFSPSNSIGTREGLFQKNLSGLLPVRDLRLDPSLLYSLPLLALSPNLLVVWIFLSVVFFLAKVRCG